MSIEQVTKRNALVFRDNIYTHRWYEAFGEGVTKYLQDFATIPSDDSTGDPTEWEVTVVEAGAGVSTAVVTDRAGGALLVTTAGDEDDGWSMQLGAAAGESVDLSSQYPLYCGIRFALNDATQTDILFGVTVTDTAVLGGVTDGMYFRKVDASTSLNFVTEKGSAESATAVGTLADATYITAEFLYDGGTVRAYFNGTEQTSTADTATTFPDDQLMRLTFEFLTGEAVANTCTVEWMRLIHVK
jgi:hypothetical protein